MKRQIEIFTANCPVCQPVVEMVNDLACNNCEIIKYDVDQNSQDQNLRNKLKEYKIDQLPAIAVDGQLLDCCKGREITKEALVNAGIGQG
jgi:glutaredoxin-related protein